MKIPDADFKLLQTTLSELRMDRQPYWTLWRELADFFLPKRYIWLQNDKWRRVTNARNPNILDASATTAARILASGMMNGITSPARVWLKLSIPGYDDQGGPISQWCEEVVRRMLIIMAESNFYNAMAVLYLDLVVFGTASMLVYEDDESVMRCFNPALGEFYLGQDYKLKVNTFSREFSQTVHQIVSRWGVENCSPTVAAAYAQAGGQLRYDFDIVHLIEPNNDGKSSVPKIFPFRETYWEKAGPAGNVLAQRGFHEMPGAFPRWELTANDSYGTSPAMDALGDTIQLQHETKRKAQGIDKMLSPPIIADIQLQHRPTALLPNGITYIAGANNAGAKPLYQITAPIQEMTADIADIRTRIQEIFHNPLFNMISQLDTVRSATEINARQEEKLVLLGSVLERFQNEALTPVVERVFAIMGRAKLLPPIPPAIQGVSIKIEYDSILSTAQRASGAAPTERFLQILGNVSAVYPASANLPDWDALLRDYGQSIGLKSSLLRSPEVVAAMEAQQAQQQAEQARAAQAQQLAQGAQTLSQTDLGGGVNALQAATGGAG